MVWIAIAAVGLLLAALAPVPVATLVAPYATRPIPADCTSGSSHVPVDRVQDVAGIGSVALVAADSSAEVAFGSNTAYLLKLPDRTVLWEQPFASGEISAAFQSGVAFVFDDTIGYFLSESTGEIQPNVIESDNYRGLLSSNAGPQVQTDMIYSWIARDGDVELFRHLDFAVLTSGCVIA